MLGLMRSQVLPNHVHLQFMVLCTCDGNWRYALAPEFSFLSVSLIQIAETKYFKTIIQICYLLTTGSSASSSTSACKSLSVPTETSTVTIPSGDLE